jgi:hypothetical protein
VIAGITGAVLTPSARRPAGFVALLFGTLGVLVFASLRAWRVALYEEAIEVEEFGRRRRRVATNEVIGRRTVPLGYGMVYHVFEFRDRSRKPAKVSFACDLDPALRAWLATIPDLDEADRARAEKAVLSSEDYGPDVDTRVASLARSRTVVRSLTMATAVVSLWAVAYPRPYELVIGMLALLPLGAISLLLASPRYKITGNEDARPSLSPVMLLAGLALAVRSIDYHLVDLRSLMAEAGITSVFLLALLAIGDPAVRRARIGVLAVLLLLLLAPYSWGGLAAANTLLDRSPAKRFQTAVLDKHVVRSNRTTYTVTVAGWLPGDEGTLVRFDIDRALYEAVQIGDPLCTVLHPGALRVRLFRPELSAET